MHWFLNNTNYFDLIQQHRKTDRFTIAIPGGDYRHNSMPIVKRLVLRNELRLACDRDNMYYNSMSASPKSKCDNSLLYRRCGSQDYRRITLQEILDPPLHISVPWLRFHRYRYILLRLYKCTKRDGDVMRPMSMTTMTVTIVVPMQAQTMTWLCGARSGCSQLYIVTKHGFEAAPLPLSMLRGNQETTKLRPCKSPIYIHPSTQKYLIIFQDLLVIFWLWVNWFQGTSSISELDQSGFA